jgi:hypothetical protein
VIALSITAIALLAGFLCRRYRYSRIAKLKPADVARYRLASEKERREWIYPFDM